MRDDGSDEEDNDSSSDTDGERPDAPSPSHPQEDTFLDALWRSGVFLTPAEARAVDAIYRTKRQDVLYRSLMERGEALSALFASGRLSAHTPGSGVLPDLTDDDSSSDEEAVVPPPVSPTRDRRSPVMHSDTEMESAQVEVPVPEETPAPESFTAAQKARAWWNTSGQIRDEPVPYRWRMWLWYLRRDDSAFAKVRNHCDAIMHALSLQGSTNLYAGKTLSYHARPAQLVYIRSMYIRKGLYIPEQYRLSDEEWTNLTSEINTHWDAYNNISGWGFGKVPLPIPTSIASVLLTGVFLFYWGCSWWITILFAILNSQNLEAANLKEQYDVIALWWTYLLYCLGVLNPMAAGCAWGACALVIFVRTYWVRAVAWKYQSAIVQGQFFLGLIAAVLGTSLYYGSKCMLDRKKKRDAEREPQANLKSIADKLGIRNLKDLILLVTATPKLFELGNKLYYMFYTDPAHYVSAGGYITVVQKDGIVKVEYEKGTTLSHLGIKHGYIEIMSEKTHQWVIIPATNYLHVPLTVSFNWSAHEVLLGRPGKYFVHAAGARTGVFLNGHLHITHDPATEGASTPLKMHPGNPALPPVPGQAPTDKSGIGAVPTVPTTFPRPEYEDQRKTSAQFEESLRVFMGDDAYQRWVKQMNKKSVKAKRARLLKKSGVSPDLPPTTTTALSSKAPTPSEDRVQQGAFDDVCKTILAWVAEKKEEYGWYVGLAFAGLVFGALVLIGYKYSADRASAAEDEREPQGRKTRSRSDTADLVYGYFRDKGISLRDIIAYSTNDQENGRPRKVIVTGLSDEEPEARERFEKDLAAATHPPMFFIRSTGAVIKPLVKPGEPFHELAKKQFRKGRIQQFQKEVREDVAVLEEVTQEYFEPLKESDKDDPSAVETFLSELKTEEPALAEALEPAVRTFGLKTATDAKLVTKVRKAIQDPVETLKSIVSRPPPVDTLKAEWQTTPWEPVEKQINLSAPSQSLLQLYIGKDSRLLGQCCKVNGGLLVPKHFLPVLRSESIYILGLTGTSSFSNTFRTLADSESIPHLPIGDDLVWIPLSGLHDALRNQLGAFKEARLATRDEYKNCHHFRYIGWDPRKKDVFPRNSELPKSIVHEEAFGEARPRFVVDLPGFPGSCGSLLVACDKNDTSLGVIGVHVEGMKTGEPPLYCQPVFADMVPLNQDKSTLPFRF